MNRLGLVSAALLGALLALVFSPDVATASSGLFKHCGSGTCVDAPIKGGKSARVSLIIVSDFQCPFCNRVNPTLVQIEDLYGDDVQFVYLHNPLPFHKDARLAAIASMAAHKQGRFWPMHGQLFMGQKALKRADLLGYARASGLSMKKFKRALDNKAIADFVDRNRAIANAVEATGTPAFFINGRSLKGAQPFSKFQEVIDAEIAASHAAGRRGKRWLKARTKANNPDLAAYVWDGKNPPELPASRTRPRAPDLTVYKVDVDNGLDPMVGNREALVTLVVFAEYQCPFSGRIQDTLREIMKAYGDKVRLIFKQNPLPFHKQAFIASEAAFCAMDQGSLWEMHRKLFANQKALTGADLAQYARDLGLDVERFDGCMRSHRHKARIEADMKLATRVTAKGTPNTFVNGRKLTGAKPFDDFKTVIDEELKKAKARIAGGTSPRDLYEETVKNGKVFQPLEDKVNSFNDGSARRGRQNAPIQLVMVADFQCPFSARLSKVLPAVEAHYGDDLAYTFKNFPLSFHKQAMNGAEAFLCARDQGKGWEMHDKMFGYQEALADDIYGVWAREIGIRADTLVRCMEGDRHKAHIESEMAEARAAGVRGTPTIYINGRKFSSPTGFNLEAFTSVIDKHFLGQGSVGDDSAGDEQGVVYTLEWVVSSEDLQCADGCEIQMKVVVDKNGTLFKGIELKPPEPYSSISFDKEMDSFGRCTGKDVGKGLLCARVGFSCGDSCYQDVIFVRDHKTGGQRYLEIVRYVGCRGGEECPSAPEILFQMPLGSADRVGVR